jgi:hypothetical protein
MKAIAWAVIFGFGCALTVVIGQRMIVDALAVLRKRARLTTSGHA